MKKLKHIPTVSKAQKAFGKKIGLNFEGLTESHAAAKIHLWIEKNFYGHEEFRKPSKKQIELAKSLGHDVSNYTKTEAEAVIGDLMHDLNLEAISSQKLKPGVAVKNKWDKYSDYEVISSIAEDGTVYLKGGNGKRAWARSLTKIDSEEGNDGNG